MELWMDGGCRRSCWIAALLKRRRVKLARENQMCLSEIWEFGAALVLVSQTACSWSRRHFYVHAYTYLILVRSSVSHGYTQDCENSGSIDLQARGKLQPDLIMYTTAINTCEMNMQLESDSNKSCKQNLITFMATSDEFFWQRVKPRCVDALVGYLTETQAFVIG